MILIVPVIEPRMTTAIFDESSAPEISLTVQKNKF